MSEDIVEKIASDLYIKRFENESIITYEGRVIYSAMASWIKTIALDQPVGSKEAGLYGVSRRHIYERSRDILNIICKMYPGLDHWFMINDVKPVNIIRTRLLRHGDLLNEGFNTNIALSHPYTKQILTGVETIYGSILGKDLIYAGISIIRKNNIEFMNNKISKIEEWADKFIRDILWSREFPDVSNLEFFDPYKKVKNNYTAWVNYPVKTVDGILLSRVEINKNNYEYYIIKEKNNLSHRIDSFLISEGAHIRFMYALRKKTNNALITTINSYKTHVILYLNAYLPKKEAVLLESYAWPLKSIKDELNWIMLPDIWKVIKPSIESLGIQIKEIYNG